MKRTVALSLVTLAAVVVLAALVYAVLLAAGLSHFSSQAVQGPTPRRLWATAAAFLGFAGVLAGGLSLRAPRSRARARVGVGAGLLAALNGTLNLAVASGGPGSGNGVVGGAAALVLGLVAVSFGGLALSWSRATGREK